MDNQAVPPSITSTSPGPTVGMPVKTKKTKPLLLILVPIALIILAVPIVWGVHQTAELASSQKEAAKLKTDNARLSDELAKRKVTTGEASIDTSGFQAVFLTNGQVYFGKITGISETQVTLKDIFYLKASATGAGSDVNNPSGDVSLVKLGNELHGPQDVMYIERKEVNFWENLKSDGKVVKAINAYERQNTGS